jgi:hypothetical protein
VLEPKLYGFRSIGCSVNLWSRNQKDFNRRFTDIAKAISETRTMP